MDELVKLLNTIPNDKASIKLTAITAMCNYLSTCKYESDKEKCYKMIRKILDTWV